MWESPGNQYFFIFLVRCVTVTHRELFEFLKSKGPIRPRAARSKSLLNEYVITAIRFDKSVVKNDVSAKIALFAKTLERYFQNSHRKVLIM